MNNLLKFHVPRCSSSLVVVQGPAKLEAMSSALRHRQNLPLIAIKTLHTAIWAFFVACIVGLPAAALAGRFRLAAVLGALVLAEVLVLMANGGSCPLTDWAARYSGERAENFDIYLPCWLAKHNKRIFGALFVAGAALAAVCWLRSR